MDDVIIVGGSFAGLAGALQLGRARRKVTVLDTGLPRNRNARHSHGLLGHDHKPPLDILAEARQQLARYPTIRLVSARADSVSGAIDDFSVLTGDGVTLKARRLILSYGVVDQMPDVPGFAEGWGTSVIPCPYCDGFEVAGQHWGLVWSGPQSHNQVRLFHDWTERLTVFADGRDISPDIRADLARFCERNGIAAAIRRGEVQMVGVSGTVTTVSAHNLGLKRYNRSAVDGSCISRERILDICNQLASLSVAELAARLRVRGFRAKPRRRATIPSAGATRRSSRDRAPRRSSVRRDRRARWPVPQEAK